MIAVDFWYYNKKKVIGLTLLSFLVSSLFFGSVYLADDRTAPFGLIIAFTLLCAIVPALITTIKGINFFKTIKRLLEDEGDRSILPLFDNGFEIQLVNEHSKLFFTKQEIHGSISGLPVRIAFWQSSRLNQAALFFSFSPLSHHLFGKKAERGISCRISLRNRLKKDIKPEILQFVEDLKSKGYTTSGEE